MCRRCDYTGMLVNAGLTPLPNRLKILEVIGDSSSPLSAGEIHGILKRRNRINSVTVYRILGLLVKNRLVEKIISGDQSRRYGPAPNHYHRPHAHFFCRSCKSLKCLHPESLLLDIESLRKTFPGVIEHTQIRIDGICEKCLKKAHSNTAA
ncbi:MAG: transcriptional repressor [Desulfobacterales bacterium]